MMSCIPCPGGPSIALNVGENPGEGCANHGRSSIAGQLDDAVTKKVGSSTDNNSGNNGNVLIGSMLNSLGGESVSSPVENNNKLSCKGNKSSETSSR